MKLKIYIYVFDKSLKNNKIQFIYRFCHDLKLNKITRCKEKSLKYYIKPSLYGNKLQKKQKKKKTVRKNNADEIDIKEQTEEDKMPHNVHVQFGDGQTGTLTDIVRPQVLNVTIWQVQKWLVLLLLPWSLQIIYQCSEYRILYDSKEPQRNQDVPKCFVKLNLIDIIYVYLLVHIFYKTVDRL